jgi:two-component system chemotaxis response regulator CheB
MRESLRVVVVDGSPFVCRLLTAHLQSVPGMEVVGTARDAGRAVGLVRDLKPTAVTLGLELAGGSGLDVLESIMHDCPTPVVMISGAGRRAADVTLRALQSGAVDFVLKHVPGKDTDPDSLCHEVVAKVALAAKVKVIRSLRPNGSGTRGQTRPASESNPQGQTTIPDAPPGRFLPGVVVIGASTGGPVALRELLGALPANYPAPCLVVQHLPASFTGVLAAQLSRQVALDVKEAKEGELLGPGRVLVAPGDQHLLLRPDSRVELNRGLPIAGYRPCIDVTMQSVAQVYGPHTRGVVLTGMGDDGTRGLLAIRSKGGKTYAQDGATCVINGMPQRAIERGVVDHVASPAGIAQLLRAEPWRVPEERSV